jgi:hypothetical protein
MAELLLFIITPLLIEAVRYLLSIVLGLTGHLIYLDRDSEVERLDDWLAKNGYCTYRDTDGSALGGLHAGRLGRGFFITYRARVQLTMNNSRDHHSVFIWRAHREFREVVCGDLDGLRNLVVNCPMPGWFDLNTEQIRVRDPYRPWQLGTVIRIMTGYDACNTSGALVTGRSGTGKTTLGYMVARWFKDYRGINATVIAAFNPQLPGMNLQQCLTHTPTATRPFVVVINEWDKIIEQAEEDRSDSANGNTPSPASSKGTLLDLIDGIRRKPYVILIATANSRRFVGWRENPRAVRHPYVNYHRFPVFTEIH